MSVSVNNEVAKMEVFQIQPANAIVERMINQITSQEEGFQYLKVEKGRVFWYPVRLLVTL